jgi:hypothetical protein
MTNNTPNTPSGGTPELVVIVKPEARLRAQPQGIAGAPGVETASLQALLTRRGASMRPLFGLSEDRLRAQQARAAPAEATEAESRPHEAPDLSVFYHVAAEPGDLQALAADLLAHDLVEAAYVKPAGAPPVIREEHMLVPNLGDAPPATTPNFGDHQIYRNASPVGVDTGFAMTLPGGSGASVHVIDCEWGWRFTHEDLLQNQGGVVAGTSDTDTDHGTAVLGVVSADANGFGVTGIAPDAVISASSFHDQSTSKAIKAAADKLSAGDIILLEIHRPGPNTPSPENGQHGYIAIEWWPDDFAAIQYAVAKGVVVVEAAGNGFQNLDDPVYDTPAAGFPASWKNPFNPSNANSGAVVVGAGAPPPGTHGQNWGADRSRLDFSNYGARVDAQGWGREVTSTGYGDLQGGANADLWYTDRFNGTSSASPIVVGALAAVAGALRARGHRHLTSPRARQLVRKCGAPQQDESGRPASQRIGNRPNLRQLIPLAADFQSRSADFDGDGRAEILITSPWGIGILEQAGGTMAAPTMQPNGTRFGGWLLNTADNHFGWPGDYDGDGKAEITVVSPWGLGILKQSGNTLAAPMMQPNGTRFGDWLLNTHDNSFGPAADYDGDGRTELLVASPWGLGILEMNGTTMAAPMMAPNGTRFGGWLLNTGDNSFGPVGDFDGDGRAEILVTSPWGIGVMKLSGNTLTVSMMAPNGTRFGGWLLNTADNVFGPVGDFDGDGHVEILVTSPWGVGVLKLSGSTFDVPMMSPNGTRFGGWLLNTADNEFGPVGDFDGSHRAGLGVQSPWGGGILQLSGGTFVPLMMEPNGARFGNWLLNTADNWIGTAADYDGDGRAEMLVTSPWGLGILKHDQGTLTAPMMQPNGTRFGGWLLNTADNDVGHGY